MGASGFVGAALCRELTARGHEVVGVVRDLERAPAEFACQVAELGDPDAIALAAKGCEVLFHCAGIASARADRRALEWVNVAGTENVINAARVAGVKRVVHVSCADVSLVNADRIHWGESRVITQGPLDWHARTKLLAEEVALIASGSRLEVTALRPAWLWGAGDHTNLPLLCDEASRGGVRLHGNGENLFAALHIDNFVPALIAAATAQNAAGHAYYLADQEPLTADEFFSQLCRACGLSAPRRGMFLVNWLSAWMRERTTSDVALVSEVVRRGRGSLFDVQAAVRDLNFAPSVSVEDGMSGLADWVKAQGGPAAVANMRRARVARSSVDAQVRRADEHVPEPPRSA